MYVTPEPLFSYLLCTREKVKPYILDYHYIPDKLEINGTSKTDARLGEKGGRFFCVSTQKAKMLGDQIFFYYWPEFSNKMSLSNGIVNCQK